MLPELKKRKVDGGAAAPPRRTVSHAPEDKDKDKVDTSFGRSKTSGINLKIQQERNFAVAQAQQEQCTGNYRIFDSLFGNYLVPVLPTRAELRGVSRRIAPLLDSYAK